MPIVTVELVGESENEPELNLAQSLADAIGRALASPPGQIWVRLRWLAHHEYAENESLLSADQLPVFITVTKREIPTAVELEAEVAAVTAAVAGVVGRASERVHVEYAPAGAGRIWFGGNVVQ
jgi:phenylpyruvate tautomerase PptA (4-oxalocrotonate tautomerase family)